MKLFTRVLCAALLLLSAQSYAATYGFNVITNNGSYGTSFESMLEVDINSVGGNVAFTFRNLNADFQPYINGVYFDDNASVLSNYVSFPSSGDVVYQTKTTNLPAGNTIGFDADWSFVADPPPTQNGINGGEEGTFVFSLLGGASFDDLIAAIGTGDLRLGIHVQGFRDGSSESYVNEVPEPSTYLLLAMGIIGLMAYRKKAA